MRLPLRVDAGSVEPIAGRTDDEIGFAVAVEIGRDKIGRARTVAGAIAGFESHETAAAIAAPDVNEAAVARIDQHGKIDVAVAIEVGGCERAVVESLIGCERETARAVAEQHAAVAAREIELAVAVEVGRDEIAAGVLGDRDRGIEGAIAVSRKQNDLPAGAADRHSGREIELRIAVEIGDRHADDRGRFSAAGRRRPDGHVSRCAEIARTVTGEKRNARDRVVAVRADLDRIVAVPVAVEIRDREIADELVRRCAEHDVVMIEHGRAIAAIQNRRAVGMEIRTRAEVAAAGETPAGKAA